MMCKICTADLTSAAGERRSIAGKAVGARAVYMTVYDCLKEKHPDSPAAVHQYIASEPAFLCKRCFTVFKKYSDIRDELTALKEKLHSAFLMAMGTVRS